MFKKIIATCIAFTLGVSPMGFAGNYTHCNVKHTHRDCHDSKQMHKQKYVYAKAPYGYYASNHTYQLKCSYSHYHQKHCYKKYKSSDSNAFLAGALIIGSLIAISTTDNKRRSKSKIYCHSAY